MNKHILNASLALSLLIGVAPLAVGTAEAKSDFMAACSAKYKAAKAGGTIDSATKWTDFLKTQCASTTSAAQAATAAPTVAPTAKSGKKTTPVAVQAAANSNANFMKTCSLSWGAMKSAGTIPAGMKWSDFVKSQCVTGASAAAAPALPAPTTAVSAVKQTKTKAAAPAVAPVAAAIDPTPPEPATVAATSTGSSLADKNGKPYTPGQIAAHQRITACGVEWRNDKTNGTLPSGEKWPQFWSSCNTRLKAQG
jgi:hypothetical protein